MNQYKYITLTAFFFAILFCGISQNANAQMPKNMRNIKPSAFLKANFDTSTTWNANRFNASVALPAVMNEHMMMMLSSKFEFSEVELRGTIHGYDVDDLNIKGKHFLYSQGVTAFFNVQVWNKTLSGGLIANLIFNDHGFGGGSGVLLLLYNIVENPKFTFGIGAVGILSSALSWPVYPLISLKWTINDQMMLEVGAPKTQFVFRPAKKYKMIFGTELEFEKFYFAPDVEDLPDIVKFSSMSLRTSAAFEYRPIFPLGLVALIGFDYHCTNKFSNGYGTKQYFKFGRPIGGVLMIKTSMILP